MVMRGTRGRKEYETRSYLRWATRGALSFDKTAWLCQEGGRLHGLECKEEDGVSVPPSCGGRSCT